MQTDISSCMLVVLKEAYRSGGCVKPFGGGGGGGIPCTVGVSEIRTLDGLKMCGADLHGCRKQPQCCMRS